MANHKIKLTSDTDIDPNGFRIFIESPTAIEIIGKPATDWSEYAQRLEAIVREFAENPMFREAHAHSSVISVCAFCNTDSDQHRESCLYRRAIEATKDGSR